MNDHDLLLQIQHLNESDERKRDWKMFATFVFASLAVIVALGAAGLAFVSRYNSADQYRADTQATWRAVICAIEQQVAATQRSNVDKQTALQFYDRLLVENIHTEPCGIIITRR
jgi:hypothetical protein